MVLLALVLLVVLLVQGSRTTGASSSTRTQVLLAHTRTISGANNI